MKIDNIQLDEAQFSQRQLVAATEATNAYVDMLIRDNYLQPHQIGARGRAFSIANMIAVDLVHLLVKGFGMKPSGAAELAAHFLEDYRPRFDRDVLEIAAGGSFHVPLAGNGYLQAEGYTRDAGGELRKSRADDDPAASVMLSLPVQIIARRVLERLRDLPDTAPNEQRVEREREHA